MPGPRLSQTPILLATGNPAKQRMLAWLLEETGLLLVTPQQLGLDGVPDEDGDTHLAVARDKAKQWSRSGSTLAIASDGGLVIPALGEGWESLYTHRFAGTDADDHERAKRLLELMQPYQGADREASWIEALAIADRGRVLASWELRGATGVIAESTADDMDAQGFWAFSLWCIPKFGKRYSDLNAPELESLDDHWTRLRFMVRRYLQSFFVPRRG
jgi:inosine/xanthosine triphosphate pyrophosphatase family protein